MMNWLKRETETGEFDSPVRVENDTLIEAPRDDIYARLDFASPTNGLRQRGFDIARDEKQDGLFHVTDPRMPTIRMHCQVTEARTPTRYVYTSRFESPDSLTGVVETQSAYTFERLGPELCRVHLVETSKLKPGLSRDRYVMERASLSFAAFRALTRLKLQIELGLDIAAFDADIVES